MHGIRLHSFLVEVETNTGYIHIKHVQQQPAGPVVQKMDSAIHQINHNPLDSVIDFPNIYMLDNDVPGGQCYPTFEQPGPAGSSVPRNEWSENINA